MLRLARRDSSAGFEPCGGSVLEASLLQSPAPLVFTSLHVPHPSIEGRKWLLALQSSNQALLPRPKA